MFRATHRSLSGAQKLSLQPLVLHIFVVAGSCHGWVGSCVVREIVLDVSTHHTAFLFTGQLVQAEFFLGYLTLKVT